MEKMLNNNWDIVLSDIINSEKFNIFFNSIKEEYKKESIFPRFEDIFKAFKLTDYDDVKVVILGQDPYHGENQANGLAFSVESGQTLPPSLRNIFKEINNDFGIVNTNGDLSYWAKQGVFLLNSVLTVKKSKPGSFANTYWEEFTDIVINRISKRKNIVFLLWGKYAQSKESVIEDGNYIIKTSHPSPFSVYRGFRDSNIFSETNKILKNIGSEEIDWRT